MLGSDYQTQVRSLLYQAYRLEPTFEWLFEAERIGYEHRVRATLCELVQAHFAEGLPAIGLLVNEPLEWSRIDWSHQAISFIQIRKARIAI